LKPLVNTKQNKEYRCRGQGAHDGWVCLRLLYASPSQSKRKADSGGANENSTRNVHLQEFFLGTRRCWRCSLWGSKCKEHGHGSDKSTRYVDVEAGQDQPVCGHVRCDQILLPPAPSHILRKCASNHGFYHRSNGKGGREWTRHRWSHSRSRR